MQYSQPKHLKEGMTSGEFSEERYRWVIIAIGVCVMILNGLLNNMFIPIANKLSAIYDESSRIVNLPIIISFLVFSLINIPVNYFIDSKGFRAGYLVGLSIYSIGIFLVTFINSSFSIALIGYIIFAFGQPFILNAPAKIATYWFLPQNRALATSILVAANVIGSGMGFAIPTLVVGENSTEQKGKKEIYSLYLGYALATAAVLVLNVFFLRSKPSSPTSNIESKEELTLKETFQQVKQDKNIWKFLGSYWLIFGSFQTFASSANLLIKPFGISDIDISLSVVLLIILGVTGSVVSSLYLKKYRKYRRIFRFCCVGALIMIIILFFQLMTINSVILLRIIVGVIGFFITPIIPISYEIGCEIAFPIGEAQITGLLNGGSLIWAFISDSILTLIIGFGTTGKSLIFISVIILFIALGNVFSFMMRVNLKRKHFEQSQSRGCDSTRASSVPQDGVSIEMQNTQKTIGQESGSDRDTDNENPNYQTLQEQNF